jgi:hypothetical protein
MSDFESMLRKNIETINRIEGFDVVILCCSSTKQADYWQNRLEQGKGSVMSTSSTVLAVEEDWPGGAGNGIYYSFF